MVVTTVVVVVVGLVRAEIHRFFDAHLHLRVLPFHVHIHIRVFFSSSRRRGIIIRRRRRRVCAVSQWRGDGAGTGARRVWGAALALLELVQDLLDVLPRKLFDL